MVLVQKSVHVGAEFLYGGERPYFMMELVLVHKTVHDGTKFLYVGEIADFMMVLVLMQKTVLHDGAEFL